jgi:tetratricopeptide (TPR) repeat protein
VSISKKRGQIKAAIKDYQQAISLNPGNAEAHYNLADAYEEIPDYEKAVDEYQRAIDADLSFYQAYNNLSRLPVVFGTGFRSGDLLRLDESSHIKIVWSDLTLHVLDPGVGPVSFKVTQPYYSVRVKICCF